MPISNAKRNANNKWDSANMVVLGCKVRRDKADLFKAACKAAGTNVNAVFTAALDRFMEDHAQAASGDIAAAERGQVSREK